MKHCIWLGLVAFATGCSHGDDDVSQVTSAAKKPIKDAAVDSRPIDSPPPPPPDAAIDAAIDAGGGGGTQGFIDACLLPGMTKAQFNPTAQFDPNDEGVTGVLSLPFSFTFHGVSHATTWFTSNGQLGFGSTLGGSAFGQHTCPLPDAQFTTPILHVYALDLVGRPSSGTDAGVCYATTGTAPNRKFVVTWKDSFLYEVWNASNLTFSATLNEGTNVIDVVLENIDAGGDAFWEAGYGAALGTQSGMTANQFSCGQGLAPEGTVIHYNP